MASNVNLPPGFQLDQASAPTGQATPQSTATPNLPQGFVLDQQPTQDQGITGQDIAQHPFQSIGKTIMQPAAESLTGKTLQQMATEKSLAGGDVAPATSRPFDANLEDVQDAAFKNQIQASVADAATTPANYVAGPLISGAVKLGGNAIAGIGQITADAKNGIANMLLNPEFKQTASDWAYNHDARRVMASIPGIIGDDFNSTKAAINSKLQETGQAIGDTIANSPASSVPIGLTKKDVTGHIDQLIGQLNQADPNGNAATIQKLLQKKVALENTFNPDGTIKGPINFQNMTPQQAFDYKQLKLGNIKFTGNDTTDSQAVNAALQQSRQNLTVKMNAALPDLTPLNQDYGDLNAAMDAADRAAFKAQGQGIGKFQWSDLVNTPINKWILNPQNRMQLAQFLYTAPKSDVQAMGKIIPNFNQTVNQTFGLPSPQSVSPVGSNIPPLNPQTQGRQFSQDFTQPGSATPILIPRTSRSASARYMPNSPASATFNIGKQDIEDAMTLGTHAAQNNIQAAEAGSQNVVKFTDLKLLNQFVSDNESKVQLISTDSDGNFYAHMKGK